MCKQACSLEITMFIYIDLFFLMIFIIYNVYQILLQTSSGGLGPLRASWIGPAHGRCHIIYVKSNSKEFLFWKYRFSSKISGRKNIFWMSKFSIMIFENFHQHFSKSQKFQLEFQLKFFEISKICTKFFENHDRNF